MAEAWEEFGAPETNKTQASAEAPAWENFGAPEEAPAKAQTPVEGPTDGWDRFTTSLQNASQKGFGGQVARQVMYYTGKAQDLYRQKYPGRSEDWYNEQARKLIDQTRRDIISQTDQKLAAGEADGWGNKIIQGAQELAGGFVGSADPTMLLAPGANAVQRMGAQGVISGAADAGYQALNQSQGVQDEIDTSQIGLNTLFGVGGQGLFEGAGKLLSKGATIDPELKSTLDSMYDDTSKSADDILAYAEANGAQIDPEALKTWVDYRDEMAKKGVKVDSTHATITPEEAQAVDYQEPTQTEMGFSFEPRQTELDFNKPTLEDTLAEEAANFRRTRTPEPTPEQVFKSTEEQPELPLGEPAHQTEMDFGEPAWENFGKSEAPAAKTPEELHLDNVKKKQEETIDGWSNSPDFEVVHSVNDIADPAIRASIDPKTKAFIGADGKVRIISQNVKPEEVPAIVFHEALGHHGLSSVYKEDLDKTLTGIYDSTPWFRNKVNKWIEKNPSAYADSSNRIARAVDEVFAGMSEDGPHSRRAYQRVYDKVANAIKEWARRAGLKMEFSPREIKSILSTAHDATIRGTDSFSTSEPREYTRRDRIKMASEELSKVRPGETKAVQPFPEEEPDYWRFRSLTSAGKEVSGTYTLDPEAGLLDNFRIGSDDGARSIGASEIRKVGRDLLAQHPEAKRISGYRISGARGKAEYVESGNRFYNEDKKSLSGEKIKTVGDLDDVLDFLGKETQPLYEGPRTINDIEREAEEFGLTASRYLKSQSLSEKKLAARVTGAKQVLTDQVQELLRLREKVQTEGLTPSLLMDLQERIATASAVFARFDNDTAELGRTFRMLREVTESRKLANDMARFMGGGDPLQGVLSSPEQLNRFLDTLAEKAQVSPGEAAKVFKAEEATGLKKAFEIAGNALNLPRAIVSTMDLSAPLRQGVFLVGRKEFWKSIPSMFKQAYSEEHHNWVRDEIMERPSYPLMKKAGLSITGGSGLANKEEAFQTNWAEKIPGAGRVVRASERGYSGFLNKLRADTFDSILKKYEEAGIDFAENPQGLKDMARFVNSATGRGDLGKLSQAGPILNATFFSPRLMASRVNLLNPYFYYTLDPIVRTEAIKSLLSFGAIATTVAGLAKWAGADVEPDPRSSDFAKIKMGNTRYDILGGFGQYLTLASRIKSDQTKKLNGDVVNLGEGYKADDIADVIKKFVENKLAPIPSYVWSYMKGVTPIGEKFDPQDQALKLFMPLFLQDLSKAIGDEGLLGAAKAAPGFFGVGVQTFDSGPKMQYDAYGAPMDGSERESVEESAVRDEINVLQKDFDTSLVTRPNARIGTDEGGEAIKISGPTYDLYQKESGRIFTDYMKEDIVTPEWKAMSPKDKRARIRENLKDARQEAKDYLFPEE